MRWLKRIPFAIIVILVACSSPRPETPAAPGGVAPLTTLEEAMTRTAENTERICVIGIDALTWDILGPMLDSGELPNFRKLIDNGSSGVLDTADTVLFSPRIWTSIATGKKPEKHGIEFFLIDPGQAMEFGKTAGSDLRKCLAVWNILSHAGRTVQVSNWMVSWPAEKINGTVISDYVEFSHGAYPADIATRLKARFFQPSFRSTAYDRFYQRFYPWYLGKDATSDLTLEQQLKITNLTATLYKDEFTLDESLEMAQQHPSDLTMLYLRSVDIASHFYWKYSQLPPDDPRLTGLERDIGRYRSVLPETYRWADEQLGKIIGRMPEDTTFIVLSDHGFRTYFNDLRSYGLQALLRDMAVGFYNDHDRLVPVFSDMSDPIDPVRKIHILEDALPGYEAATGKSREQVIEDIRTALLSVRTTSGQSLMRLYPLESVVLASGEDPPDMVFRFNAEELRADDVLVMDGKEVDIQRYIQFLELSGNHDPRAVIIVSGRNAQPQAVIVKPTTLDIVPTVLTLFDMPVGDDMDGTILFSAFSPETWTVHPLTRIASYEGLVPRVIEHVADPDRPDIIQELKTIGYIQ